MMWLLDNPSGMRQHWIPALSVKIYNTLIRERSDTSPEWLAFGFCEFNLLNPDEVVIYRRVQ